MSNITNNRLNLVIPPADVDTVIQSLETVSTTLPFLIGLEADEKRAMQSINGSNKIFVEDCLNEMGLSSDILPNFIDPQGVQTDYDLFVQLDSLRIMLEDLLDKVKDTQYLAGAEAYKVCLIYYRLVEAAAKAGLPGADERYNRLKERFSAQGPGTGAQSDDTGTPQPTDTTG